MKTSFYPYLVRPVLALICLFAVHGTGFAQTPGLIYRPASSGGNLVLDPNGDGYVSAPRVPAGFATTRDEGSGFSEIPYRQFPALANEVLGDVNTGRTGGHTDLAYPFPYDGSTGSPIAAYYNGTHLMFRVRLGGASTASKGYSVVIDADGLFASATAAQPEGEYNPGFDFEVTFASNFDVSIYDHRTSPSTKIFTGSVDQFSQRAIAASTNGGDADYFYDFYVPLSGFGGAITATTPLRLSGFTVTSGQSGLSGTVSDIGGVNFAAYGFDAWKAWTSIINTFPATSLNQLQAGNFAPLQATAPVIRGPVYAGSTSISGTSVEAAGSTVTVLRNGASIGTATVQANGTWSLTSIAASLLAATDNITATVTATGKSVSGLSNEVTVTSPTLCTTTPTVTLTGNTTTQGSRYMTGTTGYIGKQRIIIYTGAVVSGVHTYTLEGSYIFTSSAGNTALPIRLADMTSVTGTVTLSKAVNYVVTVTPLDAANNAVGCESVRSNQLCYSNGNTSPVNSNTPAITGATGTGGFVYATLSDLPAQLSSVSGTIPATGTGISVILFVNGVQTTYKSSTFTQTGTSPVVNNWTISTSGISLSPNDVLTVRAEAPSCNGSLYLSATSNVATIKETTPTPQINAGPYCGNINKLSGTAEPGSLVTIYTNNTSTNLTATTSAAGVWTLDVSSLNGGTGIASGTPVTARAKSVNKATSPTSTSVTAAAATPVPGGATFTITPVTEPDGTDLVALSGTAPASDGTTTYQVTVDINGTVFSPVASTASGTWEVIGISPLEVYPGAVITSTFSSGSGCPSSPVSSVVQCRVPSNAFATTLSSASVCYNSSVTMTLSGSERGVSYRITNNGIPTGASVLGTGDPISLTSDLLTASTTTLSVRATNLGSSGCTTTGIGGNQSVTVSAAPTQPTSLVAGTTSGCSRVTTSLTLNGPTAGYTYQLINKNTKAFIGSEITAPGTAALTLAAGLEVTATTTYGVLIKTGAGSCSSESTVSATVTVTNGPALTPAVTIDKPAPCPGETVTISVVTEANAGYTYTIRNENGVAIGASFTGTGDVVSRTTTYGITEATALNERTFYAEVTGGCFASPARLGTTVTATATTAAPAANAGAAQFVCGSVGLGANYASPGVGTWTIVGGTPAEASFSDINDPKATLTGLPSGTYTLTWTITNTCGGANTTSSNDVQITINCAAEYLVAAPKYANQYAGGDVLAFASDADGGVQSASLLSGTLPSWAEILSTGNIVVKSGATPVPGTYSFTTRTTDTFGATTDSPLTLTVYGEEPVAVTLPVELLYFTATTEHSGVILRWVTATEEDNDRFVIERGTDGSTFTALGTVTGQGHSQISVDYSFLDASPIMGTAYYRLRQIDFDGAESFSQVVAVTTAGSVTTLDLQTYPNPFTTSVVVAVNASGAKSARLRLVDQQGRPVLTRTVALGNGLTRVDLDVPHLPTGMYHLQITSNGFVAGTRIFKSN